MGRKQERSKKLYRAGKLWKRCAAVLLGVCMLLSQSNLTPVYAEGQEEGQPSVYADEEPAEETGQASQPEDMDQPGDENQPGAIEQPEDTTPPETPSQPGVDSEELPEEETFQTVNEPETFQIGEGLTATLFNGILTIAGQGSAEDYTAETAPFTAAADRIQDLVIKEGVTYIGAYMFYGLQNLKGTLTLPESITGFGTYAFSGSSKETAPAFARIINKCTALQQIGGAGTLFYAGQTGSLVCAAENAAFREEALLAGYVPEETGIERYAGESLTIFVDQKNGTDVNEGTTPEKAVKTFQRADELFTAAENAGAGRTVEQNIVKIIGTYTLSVQEEEKPAIVTEGKKNNFFKNPVTVEGAEGTTSVLASRHAKDILKSGATSDEKTTYTEEARLYLYNDLTIDNITIDLIVHIYARGNNLTIGKNVKLQEATKSYRPYLYGGTEDGTDAKDLKKMGQIAVYSLQFIRIVAYARNYNSGGNGAFDAETYGTEKIVIGGNATVDTVLGGLASGSVKNGKTDITVQDSAIVSKLVGGNQGYVANEALYQGTTRINIAGGTVGSCFSAGTGRDRSIPEYQGTIDIDITGGKVTNLYGAGAAAFIGGSDSKVNIQVSGGTVDNIYAAGYGGMTDLKLDEISADRAESIKKVGSVTGKVEINVSSGARIGNIFAGGEGYKDADGKPLYTNEWAKESVFFSGTEKIRITGGIITGSVYGGGAGIDADGYEACAGVKEGSSVEIQMTGGTVKGNIYGGGKVARVDSDTSVTVSGGVVEGNVYGGGEQGAVGKNTNVFIAGGTIKNNVYGGAKGSRDKVLVTGQTTLNMTGGIVEGKLYGGSELSDNGPKDSKDDRIFVNFAGGTVKGNVFGGGYEGYVNGSTHLHIGKSAMGECQYYKKAPGKMPALDCAEIQIGGSVYAGGDYGKKDYDTITISGTSHVYIDGAGYATGSAEENAGEPAMNISGGVFGSGASCDAGEMRIVTLADYGESSKSESENITGVTRELTAIQRADKVLIKNSHIRLTGQSDIANSDTTEKYSLNRIGDKTFGDAGAEKGLILQGGSSLMIDASVLELAEYQSLTENGTQAGISDVKTDETAQNSIVFSSGTMFRVACTDADGQDVYGAVKGYSCLDVADTAVAYVYARISPGSSEEGGFIVPETKEAVAFTTVREQYRYWRAAGDRATANRETVLTAKKLKQGDTGYGSEYSLAEGTVTLPQAASGDVYVIQQIKLPGSIVLVDAARNDPESETGWITSDKNVANGSTVALDEEKSKIAANPMSTFGLYMGFGTGFGTDTAGKVVSMTSATPDTSNSIIKQKVVCSQDVSPQIKFYLTYKNDGITSGKDLGKIEIELVRRQNDIEQETTTISVDLRTMAAAYTEQTVELYASQSGEYTTELILPKDRNRTICLSKVDAAANTDFVQKSESLTGTQYAVTLQPVKSDGWSSTGLMTEACDLKGSAGEQTVGQTDSRYDSAVAFTIYNAQNFAEPVEDQKVVLTFVDKDDETFRLTITLLVHRKPSVVTAVKVAQGKEYDTLETGLENASGKIITADFDIHIDSGGQEESNNLWLELEKEKETVTATPSGIGMTLIIGNTFYYYKTKGTENGRIPLSGFVEMWGSAALSNIQSGKIKAIADFSEINALDGTYSIHLKNETGADNQSAEFTTGVTPAEVALTGSSGASRGTQTFSLRVNSFGDIRLQEGAAVVLANRNSGIVGGFPEGTRFTYGGKNYYPSGDRVYIILGKNETSIYEITMDTTDSAGMSAGNYTMTAEVYAVGVQAGGTEEAAARAECGYTVTENASVSLQVTAAPDTERMVEAGGTVNFTAQYAGAVTGSKITVQVQQKNPVDQYTDITGGWTVSGNDTITSGSILQTITVVVPTGTASGTYRLNFSLGGQTVPCNIIVK